MRALLGVVAFYVVVGVGAIWMSSDASRPRTKTYSIDKDAVMTTAIGIGIVAMAGLAALSLASMDRKNN